MGDDEAGTATAVREHRDAATPIVRTHGGRIVKTMGDGVLIEFPSVVSAVECAIAIQELMVERAGIAAITLGDDQAAEVWLRRSIEINRNFSPSHYFLAAALANLGAMREAKDAVDAALLLNRDFTIARYRIGVLSDNPTYLARRERIIDGMRKAGLPEQ
jgi:tetratricopeptide (TPR) repeat protein